MFAILFFYVLMFVLVDNSNDSGDSVCMRGRFIYLLEYNEHSSDTVCVSEEPYKRQL